MIRDFWVENYYSIRDRQEMNFVVKPNVDEWMCIKPSTGARLSKLGIIYGANASGKSNMLKAIQNVFDLLFTSRTNRNKPVLSGMPFALTADKPTKMFVSFYIDGIRYDYYIEYTQKHILKEILVYFPKKSKSLFYERTFNGDNKQITVKFGNSVGIKSKTEDILIQSTLNNHTLLSTYGKVSLPEDAEPMAKVYNWIRNHVHGVMKMTDGDMLSQMREIDADARTQEEVLYADA